MERKMGRRIKEELEDISGEIKTVKTSLFVARMQIGGQDFDVVLDTGSINLWVPKIGSKDKVNITHHYDPKKSSASSSTSETFEITYGTGSTKGEMMRLLEMIERLSEIERQHGNVEVYLVDEDKDWYKDVSSLEFTDWDGRDRVVLK